MRKKSAFKNPNKEKPVLSPAIQQAFGNFLTTNPPKTFSRNLRSMLLELLTCQQGNYPLYFNSLIISMEMLFEVLDIAEDENQTKFEGP